MTARVNPARRAIAGTAIAGVAVLAAACGGSTPAATPTKTVTVTASPQAPAGTSPGTATGTPAAPGAAAPCPTRSLGLKPGVSQGAAGSVYQVLDFTNISNVACTLYGYPGVSLAGGSPVAQVGLAASEDPTPPRKLVTLAPGQVANALLRIVDALNFPASTCGPVKTQWIQVYPPNQTTPIYLAYKTTGCSKPVRILSVSVVQAGSGGSAQPARQRTDAADPRQDPRQERGAVQRVVPQGQRLAVPAEQHFLVGEKSRQPDRVDVHGIHVRAAGAVQGGDRGIGRRTETRLRPRGGDQGRGPGRGARRRIRLARVVKLDDLRGVEEARRLHGEPHHEHRADREVGHDQRPGAGRGGQPPRHLRGPGVVEAGGADDGIQALADAPAQVVHDRAGMGEVDHHVTAGQGFPVVPHVDAGGQRHVLLPGHRRAYLGAHAPLGAQHPDLDLLCHVRLLGRVQRRQAQDSAAAKLASSSNGPTTASALGWSMISAAARRTSSWVTASIEARISSTGSSRA